MRLNPFIAATFIAVCLTQSACAREPSKAAQPAPAASAIEPVAALSGTASTPACAKDPAAAIDAAVSATLSAVSGNSPRSLLGQVLPEGLDINGTVAKSDLSQQFAAKTGRYCDLYACAGRTGAMHRLFHSGKIDKQVDVKNGRASVFVNANTNDELDLSYTWSGCKWWLTAIATP